MLQFDVPTVTTASNGRSALISSTDPLPATIPELRTGTLSAVYYGQRRRGDFYDFVWVPPQRVLFGLFDAAGDLQPTRKILGDLQRKFRTTGTKLLRPNGRSESESLVTLWIEMNRVAIKSAGRVHYCAAIFGCYDDEAGTICYINAGHTPGLVRHKQKIRQLEATALPFGLFADAVPTASLAALNPGDALLLVSKGIVEGSYGGEEYGLQRAVEYLDHSRIESAHEVCMGLLERVRQFMHAAPTHDDVTAMALVRSA